ncbi:MAG: glycosyltransferase family 39 protein [Chloroflexi bacterium]|nr:glycosyltransferase family 39 protein [Chloroflexota bacterium]
MRVLRTHTGYLLFPIAGVLASLLIPEDRLALRVLVGAIVAGLGVLAADAGYRIADVRGLPGRLRAAITSRQDAELAARTMLAALILMIVAALGFSPMYKTDPYFTIPALVMLLGAAVLWMALGFAAPPVAVAETTDAPLQPARGNMVMAAVGVLLLLLAGELAGRMVPLQPLKLGLRGQAIVFYSGIALVVMGLGGVPRLGLPRWMLNLPETLRPRRSWVRSETLLIIVIFFAALIVRAWDLEEGLRVSVDEALAVDGTVHYFGGAIGLVGRPSDYISTLVMPQWQGELINLLGRSVTSLRLISTLVGALTVVVTYCLGRDLFKDRRTGLLAALVLLSFPPHVHFSRIALIHIADPLFGALAIWFLIRGLRFNRRLDWALAGASLAMTQYFFEAGRLFYIPLAAIWLIGAVVVSILPRRAATTPRVRIPFKGIFIAALALILVATPAYYAIFSRNRDANPRLTTSGGFDLLLAPFQDEDGLTGEEASELARRLLFPFTVYVTQPEQAVFYGGRQPLLLVYVVPFFLLGTAYLIWRWRSASVILVLWLLLTALTNALLRDSAVYARWHVVFPAVAVVTAVALRHLIPMLFYRALPAVRPVTQGLAVQTAANAVAVPNVVVPNVAVQTTLPAANASPAASAGGTIHRRLAIGVVAALTALIVVGQIDYYFVYHAPGLERQARESKPYPDGYDAALRAKDVPDYTDIYLISDPIPDINVPRIWIMFLTKADVATLRYVPLAAADFTTEYAAALPIDRNLALFIDNQASAAILEAVNAFGCTIENSPYEIDPPRKEYVLCFVDRGFGEAMG